MLDSIYQGVKRLLVRSYSNTDGNNHVSVESFKKYFLPRIKIENYNIEIDGRNFYDQPINDLIKQYDEATKISTGQGDDYTTGCLLDFAYFEKNYRLIAADLSKQKVLYSDSRVIQQMIFTGKIKATVASTRVIIYYILEQSKETTLQFSKGTTKVLKIVCMVKYSNINVKLTDTQIKNPLKTAVKNKTGTTLRMSLKMLDGNDLSHY